VPLDPSLKRKPHKQKKMQVIGFSLWPQVAAVPASLIKSISIVRAIK